MTKTSWRKLIWLAVVLTMAGLSIWWFAFRGKIEEKQLSFSEFLAQVESGNVAEVKVSGSVVIGKFKNLPATLKAVVPANDPELYPILRKNGVNTRVTEASGSFWTTSLQILGAALVLVLTALAFALRKWVTTMLSIQASSQQNKKNRSKEVGTNNVEVTLDDVVMNDDLKPRVTDVVEFLRDPSVFQQLDARIPRGILLIGPPGTGKTMIARAIAGEANRLGKNSGRPPVTFFSVSGSEFVEMFVGVGAVRVRDLFEEARKKAPSLVFIDEIDALAHHRSAGPGLGHGEYDQTLNQLLAELDGFDQTVGVVIIAATNRSDVLDPALLRAGRFDRLITIDLPDIAGRRKIFELHLKTKLQRNLIGPDVDGEALARRSVGFSGAEIMTLVNEAAVEAARQGADRITMADFDRCIDRIIPSERLLASASANMAQTVIGNTNAIETLAGAASLHYHAMRNPAGSAMQLSQGRMAILISGPIGSGKSLLAKSLADHLQVPMVKVKVTQFAAGQQDGNVRNRPVQSIARDLLVAAGGSPQKAQHGIICLEGMQELIGAEGAEPASAKQLLTELVRSDHVDVTLDGLGLQTKRLNLSNVLLMFEGGFPDLERRLEVAREFPSVGGDTRILQGYFSRHGLSELGSALTAVVIIEKSSQEQLKAIIERQWRGLPMATFETFLKSHGFDVEFSTLTDMLAQEVFRRGTGAKGIGEVLRELSMLAVQGDSGKQVLRGILNHRQPLSPPVPNARVGLVSAGERHVG